MGTTPTGSWLKKSESYQQHVACQRAREASGASIQALPNETYVHIDSAGCEGMATTVTAAHHSIWRHLYGSMNAARTPQSTLEFVTLDKESNMNTLWQRKEFMEICSKDKLSKDALNFEKEIPIRNIQQAGTDDHMK